MDPYSLLSSVSGSSTDPDEAINIASSRYLLDHNPMWQLPIAMAYYKNNAFTLALESLASVENELEKNVDWLVLAGMCARQVDGRSNDAIAFYRQAIILEPQRADIYYNLGNLLKDDKPANAKRLYEQSIRLFTFSSTAWHNYGISLNNLKSYSLALRAIKSSLLIDPLETDAWCNLGLSYFGLEDFLTSERVFRFTISIDSHHAASHLNLGNSLLKVLQPEEALSYLEKGVKLDNSSQNSIFNLSLAYLLLGKYIEGWEYYESRLVSEKFNKGQIPTKGRQLKHFSEFPHSDRSPVIIWSEQGMGDSIQFCRYLLLLQSLKVNFQFVTHGSLYKLFRDWLGLSDRVSLISDRKFQQTEYLHLPLLSLPYVFKTTLETIPSSIPYLNSPQSLPPHLTVCVPPGGISIGFTWASNPDNKEMYFQKSMPASLLMPKLARLCTLNLASLHILQFGIDSEQIADWRGMDNFYEWGNTLTNYSETAHILSCLDLVITVDTAVAHLAGALGRPTWLLLHANSDFRWLRSINSSPWYPTMRLFRQRSYGDWSSVSNEVNQALDNITLLKLANLTP